jgi:diguanylate cyclase (GGDEF)-like protein
VQLKRARLYQYAVLAVGVACLAGGLSESDAFLHLGILSLILLGIVVESIQIPLQKAYGSLTYGVVLGTMILHGANIAALLVFVAILISEQIKRDRRNLLVTLFNSSQQALCVYVASFVYERCGGAISPDSILTPSNLLLLIPVTVAYMIVNHAFVFTLFRIRGDRLNRSDYSKLFLNDGINYLISTPFAIFMLAFAHSVMVILLTFWPLLLLGQVLKLYRKITFISQVHDSIYNMQSEFDVKKVYKSIVESSGRLSNCSAAVLWVLYGDRVYPVAINDETFLDRLPMEEGLPLDDAGIVSQAIRSKKREMVNDASKDKRSRMIKLSEQFHSVLVVPLKSRDRVVGVLNCYGRRTFAFTVEQQEMVSVLAAHVGVLIENASLYTELQEATLRDPGTGLYNYRYFYQELSRRFGEVKEQGRPLSILIIDIDHFKKYNDTYGHVVGDEVLRQVGQVIQRTVGHRGVVARYGGEEFAVLLDEPLEAAKGTVEHLRRAVAHHRFEYQGYVVQGVTISAGLATYPDHDHNEKELLEKADQAMYWGAKQRGRNKVAVYTPDLDAHLFVDQLTGLYTYHYLRIKLTEEFLTRSKEKGQPFALFFFNIIEFENINRQHGFEAGNMVLRELSMILKQSVRGGEIASRYSGDEFLLLIPAVERAEAQRICERIVQAIAQHPFRVREDCVVRLQTRTDVVIYPDEVGEDHQLLSQIPDTFLHLSSKWMEEVEEDERQEA